jgi:Zn-dependent M28 family amino/carboxypeptidase
MRSVKFCLIFCALMAQPNKVITEPAVRGHMEFLASDALNGRGSGTRDEWLAAVYIASQMRRWGIEPLGDNGGYVQDVTVRRNATAAPTHTWNAIGRLTGRGAGSAEVILLTAHLDHLGNRATAASVARPVPGDAIDTIFNGADDDASGSVAVLELAEALAKGRRPRRTIIFAWFGSEEAGGFGARHFIDAPPVPLGSIVANLEFEMIGRPDAAVPPHTLWLTGYERSTLGPQLAKHGARLVADPHPAQQFFQRSDNIQLARRGVIAQTVSSFGLHSDYHRASDEVSTIDFAHMTDAVRSMLTPILWLANSSQKPTWKPGMQPQ